MMRRKLCGLLVLAGMMFTITGCRMYADYTVKEDGTVSTKSLVAYTQDEYNALDAENKANLTLETLEDGKQYYVTSQEVGTSTSKELAESGIILTSDIFYYEIGSMEQYLDYDLYTQMSITLLGDVVDTNADKSVEGKTATFSYPNNKADYWYAYTQKGKALIEADADVPKMTGAKDKKYYKKAPVNVQFTDNVAVAKVELNGKKVSAVTTTQGTKITGTSWITDEGKDAYKSGKNVFKVTDLNGNTATFTIYVDKKVPTVKGIKNKKTYKNKAVVYVKDNLKLSKITINGKTQKITNKQLVKKGKYKGYYKYTVKKKGSNKIVIKDAAGNKKTLSITIK